jgi:acyl carrier protein
VTELRGRFVKKFGVSGFRMDAFNCGYGLAEVVLTCTGHNPNVPTEPVVLRLAQEALEQHKVAVDDADGADEDTVELVGCGFATPGQTVAIADTETNSRLPEDCVGEVWVHSASVSVGYYGRPKQSEEAFGNLLHAEKEGAAGSLHGLKFLRTGDLGFLRKKQLFICGRIKDLIIVRGRNILPQDIELTAESSNAEMRPGCSAAFGVPSKDSGERLVIAAELRAKVADPEKLKAIATTVSAKILQLHQLPCEVVLLQPRTIPKTSSGKIKRHAARHAYDEGSLAVQHTLAAGAAPKASKKKAAAAPKKAPAAAAKKAAAVPKRKAAAPKQKKAAAWAAGDDVTTADDVEAWLCDHMALVVAQHGDGTEEENAAAAADMEIDPDTTWSELGLDSVGAVNVAAALGEALGGEFQIPAAAFFQYESPRALAAAPGLLTGELELEEAEGAVAGGAASTGETLAEGEEVPTSWYNVGEFDEFVYIQGRLDEMAALDIKVPYLTEINPELAAKQTNFNKYNYLGLANVGSVREASIDAIGEWGTTMSSSPIVGQTTINIDLEKEICSFLGTEAVTLFIGGWVSNVTTIATLVGPGDLVLCDSLNHDCCVQGQKLSGAAIVRRVVVVVAASAFQLSTHCACSSFASSLW